MRELENAMERAVVMAQGDVILPGDLPSSVIGNTVGQTADRTVISDTALLDLPFNEAKKKAVAQFESGYLQGLLNRASGNVSEAARLAGLDRSNFRRLLRKGRQG